MPHNAKSDAAVPMNGFIYKRLFKGRIIWLGIQVARENVNVICAQMLLLTAKNPDFDIYPYINSSGGSVAMDMAIYDTMQYIKPDVVTVTIRVVASTGQFLLTAGTKGRRSTVPHTRILIHQPLGGVRGTASEVWINADLTLTMKNELAQITAERIGHTLEEITRDADRDH